MKNKCLPLNQKLLNMKNVKLVLILVSVVLAVPAYTQSYKIVPEKSTMNWLGEKVTGEHTGNINIKNGEFVMKDKTITSGKFTIDMTSITCTDLTDEGRNQRLVNHLKSDDFFGVDKFPESSFEITEKVDFSKGSATVKGKLTIKGITNPLEFRATTQVVEDGIKIYANIVVDRTKYNVRYGSGSFFEDLGDRTIYDEFKLKINLFAKKM